MSGSGRLPWQRSDEEREAYLARVDSLLNLPLAILALLWVTVIAVELTGLVPPLLAPIARDLDAAIWLVFLAKFLCEFVVAPRKIDYLADNWVVALSVIVPFFSVLRLARAVCALRSLALVRVVLGANRATRGAAEILGRGGLQYVALTPPVAILVGSASVAFFEGADPQSELTSYPGALFWAATLVTTINTGLDPVTTEGRIITMLLRIAGLSVFGYLTTSIASYLVGGETTTEERATALGRAARELEEIRRRLHEISKRLDRPAPPNP